jgi:hypothetical protein
MLLLATPSRRAHVRNWRAAAPLLAIAALASLHCASASPAVRRERVLDRCADTIARAAAQAARRDPVFARGRLQRDMDLHFIANEFDKPTFDVGVIGMLPADAPRLWPSSNDWRARYVQGGSHRLFPFDDAHLPVETASGEIVDLGPVSAPAARSPPQQPTVRWLYAARASGDGGEVSLQAGDLSASEARLFVSSFRPALDACASMLSRP